MPTTSQLRASYPEFIVSQNGPVCNFASAAPVTFYAGPPGYHNGRAVLRVHPAARQAFRALAAVFLNHGYAFEETAGGTLACRAITNGRLTTLHAHGIAFDINPSRNRYRVQAGPIQFGRDTDIPRALIRDAEAIETGGGRKLFEWGGRWRNVKDPMHFELDVYQSQLRAEGVNLFTVPGWNEYLKFEAGATPTPTEDQMLDRNSPRPSNAVADYQADLVTLGYELGKFAPLRPDLPEGADGYWGDQTEAATQDLQTRLDLDPTGVGDALTVTLAYKWAAQELEPVDADKLATKAELATHASDGEAHNHQHPQRGTTGAPQQRQ